MFRCLKFTAALFGLAILSVAASDVSFTVDFSGSRAPFTKYWEGGAGSGHATLGLREDWRQHLVNASRDLGFKRIRWVTPPPLLIVVVIVDVFPLCSFHGVLDDDMSTYLGGGTNLFNVFSVYDFIVSLGMEPLVELSFMPDELKAFDGTVFHYKVGECGLTIIPFSLADGVLFARETLPHRKIGLHGNPSCPSLPMLC